MPFEMTEQEYTAKLSKLIKQRLEQRSLELKLSDVYANVDHIEASVAIEFSCPSPSPDASFVEDAINKTMKQVKIKEQQLLQQQQALKAKEDKFKADVDAVEQQFKHSMSELYTEYLSEKTALRQEGFDLVSNAKKSKFLADVENLLVNSELSNRDRVILQELSNRIVAIYDDKNIKPSQKDNAISKLVQSNGFKSKLQRCEMFTVRRFVEILASLLTRGHVQLKLTHTHKFKDILNQQNWSCNVSGSSDRSSESLCSRPSVAA